MTVSASEHRQTQSDTVDDLIALWKSEGYGHDDCTVFLKQRGLDVPWQYVRASYFQKHVGLAPGLQSEADFPQGHRRGT